MATVAEIDSYIEDSRFQLSISPYFPKATEPPVNHYQLAVLRSSQSVGIP